MKQQVESHEITAYSRMYERTGCQNQAIEDHARTDGFLKRV